MTCPRRRQPGPLRLCPSRLSWSRPESCRQRCAPDHCRRHIAAREVAATVGRTAFVVAPRWVPLLVGSGQALPRLCLPPESGSPPPPAPPFSMPPRLRVRHCGVSVRPWYIRRAAWFRHQSGIPRPNRCPALPRFSGRRAHSRLKPRRGVPFATSPIRPPLARAAAGGRAMPAADSAPSAAAGSTSAPAAFGVGRTTRLSVRRGALSPPLRGRRVLGRDSMCGGLLLRPRLSMSAHPTLSGAWTASGESSYSGSGPSTTLGPPLACGRSGWPPPNMHTPAGAGARPPARELGTPAPGSPPASSAPPLPAVVAGDRPASLQLPSVLGSAQGAAFACASRPP